MSLREMLHQRRDEIIAVAAKRGAYNIRIFGSVARGEERRNSDIDFLVDMAADHSLLDRAGLRVDLKKLLSKRVEVVTERNLKDRFREEIFREAVPL